MPYLGELLDIHLHIEGKGNLQDTNNEKRLPKKKSQRNPTRCVYACLRTNDKQILIIRKRETNL